MSVELVGGTIRLVPPVGIEDAEPLVSLLQADRSRPVDITYASHLHTAVVQALLVFRARVTGPAADPFVEKWLMPHLAGEAGTGGCGATPGHARNTLTGPGNPATPVYVPERK